MSTSDDLSLLSDHRTFMATIDKILSEVTEELALNVLKRRTFTCDETGMQVANPMGYPRYLYKGCRIRVIGEEYPGELICEVIDMGKIYRPPAPDNYYILLHEKFHISKTEFRKRAYC